MIKKILLTLPLFSLFFINFSFAGVCSDHGIGQYDNNFKWQFINGYSNNFNSDYNYGGLPLGNVETLYNNTTKKIIAVNRNTLFWWQENGKPYIFRNNNTQGEPDRIITCNKNTEIGFHGITGCNCVDLSGNLQNIINFMGTIKTGDYIGVAKLGAGFFVCFSSEELSSSMCFGESTENYSDTHLSNSKNYSNIEFSNLNENLLFDSPGFLFTGDSGGGYNSGGWSPISGGYSYMNCTNQNVLAYYVKTFGYNGDMCNIQSGGVVDGYYPYGTLLEFCNIYYTFYNIDGTYLNQLYTGHNKNIVCDSSNAYFDYSGNNVSIDWSDEFPGVINGSGEYEVQSSDSFLINLTNILKGNFYLPESGDFGLGYLPRYIILGFMGVIFFNFIRK